MTEIAATLDCATPAREPLARELARRVSPATVIRGDEPLARRTTLRVGGPAEVYVEPASEADLAAVVEFVAEREVRLFVLGRGSNLLVRDGGIRGVVLCLAHPGFSAVEIIGERIRCGAGAKLKHLAVEARRAGLSGVEFLEGIPGSVGGALRMNAGAMGSWAFAAVESIRFMNYAGQIFERAVADVPTEYRACPLLKNHIALGAVFKCHPTTPEEVGQRMNAFSAKRWDSQPAAPSAGCCFKNPAAIPAGRLIQELGLKGFRIGGAMVSMEHGNFIVNDGRATAKDVLNLMALIRERAKTERGIDLQPEVEIAGED
jgi:UDP-N-acetylenolpyruvoylglucosamine reductase